MIYTELTKKALRLAYEAHTGQEDKAGIPYICHPLHLAEQMNDEISTCVALLHDVVEDTDWTFEALADLFPESVVGPLRLLTKGEEAHYFEYIRKLSHDPVARKVKLADLAHNSDLSRFAGCREFHPSTMETLLKRYSKAQKILREIEGDR